MFRHAKKDWGAVDSAPQNAIKNPASRVVEKLLLRRDSGQE
jgi:hypothetical protein